MSLVFIFPGQASCYHGMIEKLASTHRASADVLELASDVLGRDLRAHYQQDENAAFARAKDSQVGIFLANHMYLSILRSVGVTGDLSIGMDVGEYNHLVHIGALDIVQALRLVEQRGIACDEGPRGMMASVYPMERQELETIIFRVRHKGIVEISSFDSPLRHVLSGETEAVKAAIRLLGDETYARAEVLKQSVPMNSSIFNPVGEAFRLDLEGVHFVTPRIPYLPNHQGEAVLGPIRETFVDQLSAQVCSPVLWRESIDHVVGRSPSAVFVEVGPGKMLCDLLDQGWKTRRKYFLDSEDDLSGHLDRVMSELLILAPAETK